MTDQPLILAEAPPPIVAHPCATCGHAREEHGQDYRDTSCTICTCPEFTEARG